MGLNDIFWIIILFIVPAIFLVGMFKPSLIIRWGNPEKKNRIKVFLLCLGVWVICISGSIITINIKNSMHPEIKEAMQAEQKQKEAEQKEKEREAQEKLYATNISDAQKIINTNNAENLNTNFLIHDIKNPLVNIESNNKYYEQAQKILPQFNALIDKMLIIESKKYLESDDFNNAKNKAELISASPEFEVEKNRLLAQINNRQAGAINWKYAEREDKMSGGKTKTVTCTSTNMIAFKFPYEGNQYARLTIQDTNGTRLAIISIEKGQFMPIALGNEALIKFDDGNPIRFSLLEPNDGSTTFVAIENSNKFISLLAESKKVYIQTAFYQEGRPVLEFNVEGFRL